MDRRSLGRGSRIGASRPRSVPSPLPTTPFRADAFALALPPGWRDASTITLAGPVADGQSHQVTVVATEHDGRSLMDLTREQVDAVRATLPGGAVLMRDEIALDDGAPAVRFIFRWSPTPERVLYQQQVYAIVGDRAVVMASSFTARSRRLVGPEVDRMMRSLSAPMTSASAQRRDSLRPRLGR